MEDTRTLLKRTLETFGTSTLSSLEGTNIDGEVEMDEIPRQDLPHNNQDHVVQKTAHSSPKALHFG